MPTPGEGESKKDFLARCIPLVVEEGKEQDQAVAVCQSICEEHYKEEHYEKEEPRANSRERRTLSNTVPSGLLGTKKYRGRDHLVIPVVALVGDAVVRPMNGKGAEYVPASQLMFAPSGWDGRPVVMNHPNGGMASANVPTTLESMAFGQIFNTRFHDGKLKSEAWLDIDRARELGGLAQQVVDRCLQGKMVEVSVGVWITAERLPGKTKNGVPYEYIWRDIVPDHLAMLPDGVEGACSIEMGCGAPRAASSGMEVRAMAEPVVSAPPPPAAPPAPPSATALKIAEVLGAYGKVVSIDESNGTVVVEIDTSAVPAADAAKIVAVEPKAMQATPRAACSCENHGKERNMAEEAKKAPELTEEEQIAALPEGLRSMFSRYQAEEKKQRVALIAGLAAAQKVYSEETLDTKSTDDLRDLAAMLKLDEPKPDYSGRALPRASADEDVFRNPPDPYDLAGLEAKRLGKTSVQ